MDKLEQVHILSLMVRDLGDDKKRSEIFTIMAAIALSHCKKLILHHIMKHHGNGSGVQNLFTWHC